MQTTHSSPRTLLLGTLTLAAALATTARVSAAPFTNGNLVIYRAGTGTAALASAATAVYLDEYTTAGVLVQSIALPTAATGADQPLTTSGTSTSEGLITRSTDGRYLMIPGYATVPGTASITGSTGTAIKRVVGRADASGVVDTSMGLADFSSGGNPRSIASTNGTDLWLTGANGGIRYATFAAGTAGTSTQLVTTPTNLRQVRIFSGQLLVTTSSGTTIRFGLVGTGTPTTTGQTITSPPGLPTSGGSPYGFFLADLDATVAGPDTLYSVDDSAGSGILKFSLVGGTWVSNGLVVVPTARGLTGTVSGTTVTLYTTNGSALGKITDTAGYNAANNGTVTSIATAGTNTAFRGVDWAPVSATPIDTWRVAKFGSGATNTGLTADGADFDSDGISNLLEYGLGIEPTSASGTNGAPSLPSIVTGSTDPLLSDRLAISFTIPAPAPADVTYIVQAADGLNSWVPVAIKIGTGAWSWTSGGTSHVVTSTTGAVETVQVGDLTSIAAASGDRRQLRLKITNP